MIASFIAEDAVIGTVSEGAGALLSEALKNKKGRGDRPASKKIPTWSKRACTACARKRLERVRLSLRKQEPWERHCIQAQRLVTAQNTFSAQALGTYSAPCWCTQAGHEHRNNKRRTDN